MVESVPIIMNDLYDQMIKRDYIKPNITSYEHLLSILSYYGNSALCLYYFKELTNTYNLRPNIFIFNSLISSYCNEISLFTENEENINDPLYYEKQFNLMENNIDRIFQIYDNCKQLLIAPNIDTMKLLFHSMNARIMLSQNKQESDEYEYTLEFNQNVLNTLENDDITNYNIHIDKELVYHIINCYILLQFWIDPNSELDMEPVLQIYDNLCKKVSVVPHWRSDNCISLVNIPRSMYEDQWIFYLVYVIEYEMDKLRCLDELRIEIPKYELDNKTIHEIQQEIEQSLGFELCNAQIEEHCISFVLTQCKDKFI